MTDPKSILLALTALASGLVAQDNRESQIAWLQSHAATDLDALGEMIGEAEVVFLGEATHGDGSCFAQKVEIAKHLHRKLEFSVIAFESGFYECHKAWQEILDGRDAVAAAGDAVFGIWSQSAQVAPLWHYIGEQSQTDRPLELAGWDFQASGIHTRRELYGELKTAVKEHARELSESEVWAEFAFVFEMMSGDQAPEIMRLDEDRRVEFLDAAPEIADALWEHEPFLAQAVRSLAQHLRFTWHIANQPRDKKIYNLRETQGAENLQWLRRELYPDRKIIVWGATSHLSRNRQLIKTDVDRWWIPFGHHVAKQMGDKVFMLGFDSHHGVRGIARKSAPRSNIGVAPKDSFAELLHAAGLDTCYVDLRSAAWLREKRVARLMGHSEMRADWSQVVDAICYIPVMKPSEL